MSDLIPQNRYRDSLDAFSKIAFVSGFVVALAYVSGYVYQWVFYFLLDSSWAVEQLSIQDLVTSGMPRVAFCTVLSLVALRIFRSSREMWVTGARVISWYTFFIMICSSFAFMAFGVILETYPIVNISAEYLLIIITSSSVALAGRMALENADVGKTFNVAVLSLFCTLVLLPSIAAQQSANAVLDGKGVHPIVYANGQYPKGILIGTIAGRLMVYDCRVPGAVELLESSKSYSVKSEAAPCVR